MWTVQKPTFQPGETFRTCISKVKNTALKQRLASVEPAIVAASISYDANAQAQTLNLIPTSSSVNGVVTAAEMTKVYDQRMAGKDGPGRSIYDQIKLLPEGDRCPFCDQRNISTLDHILPKAFYPSLAVAPLNLVAACMECNKIKLSLAPQSQQDVILHPYFDNITADQWLFAGIMEQSPCVIIFRVDPPAKWNAVLNARVNAQFELLGLSKLYSSEAAREISNIRHNLGLHFKSGGAQAVQDELLRQWHSRRANRLNSWQTAMYHAASHSDWFCSSGFI